MSLNVNIIDCPYLFAIAKYLVKGEEKPRLDYCRFRDQLERVREEKKWPSADETYLFIAGNPADSANFVRKMRKTLGFQVILQDRDQSMYVHTDLAQGYLRYVDVSHNVAATLGSLRTTMEQEHERDNTALMVLGGSYGMYRAVGSLDNPHYIEKTMMLTYGDYDDEDLYRKAGLGSRRAVPRLQHYDLTDEGARAFGAQLWASRTPTIVPRA